MSELDVEVDAVIVALLLCCMPDAAALDEYGSGALADVL